MDRLGPKPGAWLWPASAFVGGVAAFVVAVLQERRCFNKIAPLPSSDAVVMHREPVGVEPAETYRDFKFFADELGILYHDPANRRLLLVTTSHCCALHDADVIALTKGEGSGGSGVRVDARVGSADVSVVLSARKDLYDPNNLGRPYDPKGYFMERLLRTLKASGFGPELVGAHEFEDGLEDDEL
jgi:hypothetical protein